VLRTLAQLVEYRRGVSSSAAPVATAQVRVREDRPGRIPEEESPTTPEATA